MTNMVAHFGRVAGELPGLPARIRERVVARRAIQAPFDG